MSKVFATVGLLGFMGLSLFHSETLAVNSCSQIFANGQVADLTAGARLLHERDPKLFTSSSVEKVVSQYHRVTGRTLTQPADKINHWLNHLGRLSEKAEANSRVASIINEALYKQYIMKTEDVPESYYDFQARLARERGHGDIEITRTQKAQMAATLTSDQKISLDRWIDYLISKDTQMYPMWLKYWMFSGMVKLSKYNSKTGTFGNRSKQTVAPFPELNREALAYIADAVLKKLDKQSLGEIKDPEFVKLLEGMNFGNLYGRTLQNLGVGKNGQFKTNEGRWVIYPRGSDFWPLVNSLRGQNTGWCTAGPATAMDQLARGDFHIYYSLDEHGKATIPRVAIRMVDSAIAEIRGVAANQNLDPQINQSSIVSSKMKEFGTKATSYEKKDHDMKRLTEIDRKNALGETLSREELRFLYEVENKIEGFGYEKDPRIDRIKSTRDLKEDSVIIYDYKYSRDEISTTAAEALNGKAKLHIGNLVLENFKGTKFPEVFDGNLYIHFESVQGLILPEVVNGNLYIVGNVSYRGLKLPKTVNGILVFWGLKSFRGLKMPEGVTDYEGPSDAPWKD